MLEDYAVTSTSSVPNIHRLKVAKLDLYYRDCNKLKD